MADDYYEKHRGICDKCCASSIETEKIGQQCEHCKGTIVYNAPWSERHDVLPEPMTCGRRKYDQFAPGITEEQEREYREAVRRTRDAFEIYMKDRYGKQIVQ